MNTKEIGLYIHIPFCKSKCHYCDFNSLPGRELHIPQYFEALKKELQLYTTKAKNYSIKSIFIGGGTPSLADPEHITNIMYSCREHFNIKKNAEISIETNPGTLSFEKLAAYKSSGINRLSMGLQAWQSHILNYLGRIHSAEDFVENFNQARKAGFTNINADLIFGIPSQTMEEWRHTLTGVVNLGPEHLSCYSLKIEEGTVFGEKLKSGELNQIDDDIDREMYHSTIEILSTKGYNHYEISNFAKPGYECRHNLLYWKIDEYIGLGAGAHSYFEGNRYNNVCSIERYIAAIGQNEIPRENVQWIDKKDSISEFIILGLRVMDGISLSEFQAKFSEDIFDLFGTQIDKLSEAKLLELREGKLKLTSNGLDFANQVFVEFI
ncbi:MAG: radical SAM family heme chaperone HemW [Clostridia bacterium]|nr:radical SAM family heme chaperone HemW [Clostridia bacterium]